MFRLLLRTDFGIRFKTSLLRFAPSISLTLLLSPLENPPSTSIIRPVARLTQLGGGGGGGAQISQTKLPPPSLKKQNIKKVIDVVSKTITLHLYHSFWYISLPSLYANYYVKFPNFTFEGGHKHTTTNFSFSF